MYVCILSTRYYHISLLKIKNLQLLLRKPFFIQTFNIRTYVCRYVSMYSYHGSQKNAPMAPGKHQVIMLTHTHIHRSEFNSPPNG